MLGIYAVASWIIYQVVLSLYEGIGLPDWVPGTALVLLLIGLPVVLATAFVQEGAPGLGEGGGPDDAASASLEGLETAADPLARRTADPPPGAAADAAAPAASGGGAPESRSNSTGGPGRAGLLTWSRAITGGVLAFALLGLATTGFMGMRALGIGPAATLLTSGVLDEQDRLVLADFEAVGGHDNAGAVRAALRTDLESSTAVRLLDEATVEAALGRMEREPGSPLTAAVARELALREGLKATLEGEVTRLGSGWVVAARIVAAATGEPLATFRETADDESGLIAAVDRLSRSIRGKVGEKLSEVRASEPLEAVTTSSLEALRLYARAAEAHDRRADFYGASILLEQALAQDSTFAMAWRKLAVALGNAGLQPSRRDEAIERAFRLRDRLTARERLVTEGTYHMLRDDYERAIRAYRAVLERYPTDPLATTNLPLALVGAGRYEQALASIRRSYELGVIDPFLPFSEASSLWSLGREDDALAAARRGAAELPNDPAARIGEVLTTANSGQYDRADSLVKAWERDLPDEGSGAYFKVLVRGSIDGVRGRQARVDGLVDRFVSTLAPSQYRPAIELGAEWASQHATLFGDLRRARQRIDAVLRMAPLDSMLPADRPYLALADAYAHAGARDRALEMLAAWEAQTGRSADELPVLPALLLADSDPEAAVRRLRVDELAGPLNGVLGCMSCDYAVAAYIMLRADRPDSAMVLYTRYVEAREFGRLQGDNRFLPVALERLGQLHDEREETEKAVEYYVRFVELWEDVDPPGRARVEAARRRLAALAGEGGG